MTVRVDGEARPTRLEHALQYIVTERRRQEALKDEGKFPATARDDLSDETKLAILAEEFGEVARAVNEIGDQPEGEEDLVLLEELTHVAAVAVAWMEAILDG